MDILSLKETRNFWPNYWEYSKTINTNLCDTAMNNNSIAVFFVCENNSAHWPPFLNDDAIAPITSKYGLEKSFNQQLYPNHQVAVELTLFHGWVWPFTRKYSQLVANGRKMKHNTAPTEILFFIWHKRQPILGIQNVENQCFMYHEYCILFVPLQIPTV